MIGYIYLVTNSVNGKRYVGFTTRSVPDRWKEHVQEAYNHDSDRYFNRAIRKYGPENFTIRKLYSGTVENALRMETGFIAKYKTFAGDGRGYNLTYGGEGTVGYHHSQETCEKMSLAKKGKPGRKQSHETREKLSLTQKDVPESEKSKLKNSLSHMGHLVSTETRGKMSLARKGKPNPMTGRKHSKETRGRMSLARKGKSNLKLRGQGTCSKETCEKLSPARRRLT